MPKVIFILLFIFSSSLFAEVPNEITYQGRLKEASQVVTGTRTMCFKIYNVSEGGSDLWSSGNRSVNVKNGIFSEKLSPNVDWRSKDFWIETIIDNKILSPREKLTAQVFALHSRTSEDIEKSSGNIHFAIAGSTYIVIGSTGNVGIGTNNPTALLDVKGSLVTETISATKQSRVSGYLSSAQTIATDSISKIQFNAELFDENNEFDTTTSIFMAKNSGYYYVYLCYYFYPLAAGFPFRGYIYKNGVIYVHLQSSPSDTNHTGDTVACIMHLNIGDTISFYTFQSTGSSKNLCETSAYTRFDIYQLP